MSKLEIGEVTRSVGQRMPWQVASRVLNALNIPPSKGWEKTIERYDKAMGFADEAIQLFEAYRQHLVSGEKSVRLYAQKPGYREEFVKWLCNVVQYREGPSRINRPVVGMYQGKQRTHRLSRVGPCARPAAGGEPSAASPHHGNNTLAP